jgi:microsomal dipeptidase-like Zn-dependent dipeptidase
MLPGAFGEKMKMPKWLGAALPLAMLFGGCGDSFPPVPKSEEVHSYVGACVAVGAERPGGGGGRFLRSSSRGAAFSFATESESRAARFVMKPSDLGTFLFRDTEHHHLVSDGVDLQRALHLESDVTTVDDETKSGAEWVLDVSPSDAERLRLRHLDSGKYLGMRGLVDDEADAALISLFPQTGCVEFPELTLDAEGVVQPRTFDDGSVFGIVDTHSHLLSNLSFGGGGIFHGAPFHRLGVEHALSDCTLYHGFEGRKDLLGFGFDNGGPSGLDEETLLIGFVTGRAPEFNHHTEGYPTFTTWPSARFSSTHQQQYYKWLQRAYLGGLRLVVQHATSNQVICDLLAGGGIQPVRYSCNDMVAVDRILEETRTMERYIDAQEGGPGRGWFRIVTSPAEARAVINEGKMAVILGIEVSNLFDCFLVPPPGSPTCDEAYVLSQIERYHEMGVRAIFPVHKFDNAFSAGDGDRNIMELANFIQTGHMLNFTEDCPDLPSVFDKGDVTFGGLNEPREDYFEDPPHDMSGFGDDPLGTLLPFIDFLFVGPLNGDYCQNHGLTGLGEFLIEQLMARGMIIEIDHLPRRGYQRAFEMLQENDYPAAGTHGNNNRGELYALGGVSKTGLGRCHDPTEPGTSDDGYQSRINLIREMGGDEVLAAEGFGFDLNGFAGAPGPRFGPNSVCNEPQSNPVTYPFTSWAGDVTFTEPRVGERTIDFNTEGFAHIGMLPELIEDVRRDGVPAEDLEPLFKSAEAYLRMWEKAEARAAALQAEGTP